jgi:hypothetical protein
MGWKRCAIRRRAQFSKGERQYSSQPGVSSWLRQRDLTVNDGTTRILGELKRMGIGDWNVIISTNVQLRNDGLPRSGQREPSDPGAAVYWRGKDDRQQVMAIDRYDRVADNLAAIAATLEAMRAIERHGGAEILERAFTGFAALPAPGQVTVPWRQVLGIDQGATVSTEQIEQRYRALRSAHHPDKGGSAETFHAVQVAYEQARQEVAS